jgi:hypothetical protein
MIKVWSDSQEAGMLDRSGERGSSFAYLPEALPARSVSATMPASSILGHSFRIAADLRNESARGRAS